MRLLNVAQVSEVTHRHPETVRSALGVGELHGYQNKRKGPWAVHEECAIAWRMGQPCEHQAHD